MLLMLVLVESPTGSGYPKKVHEIWVTLTQPMGDVFRFEAGSPKVRSEEWENAIGLATLDPLFIMELRGDQFPAQRIFNCSYCGGGLGYSSCRGCHASYPRHGYTTETIPLPPKLIALLRDSGHEFGLRPERLLAS